jgi:hypothetical protein
MSEELRKQLQYRIDGAASILNVTASEVRKHRPVKDFLIDAMGKRWGAIEIASQALAYLCRPEKEVWDKVICIAVVGFLDEFATSLATNELERQRRMNDCFSVATTEPSTPEKCAQWARTWYS